MWISIGSVPERCDTMPGKYYSTHVVVSEEGEVAGMYRKLHLFDVNLDPPIRESDRVAAGGSIGTVIQSPVGKLGLSICYDLRFPEMYRKMVENGAEVLLVPSAFLEKTGYAHWEPLLRARAIENQCYVVAAGWAVETIRSV